MARRDRLRAGAPRAGVGPDGRPRPRRTPAPTGAAMDFFGDVKQAIPRPAVHFTGIMSHSGPSPLLQGWREFRRSGAPVRFFCFEGGTRADVFGEVAAALRRAFLEGRVVAEAAYGGSEFLFDFLRMARIDACTAEEVTMGWIDDRGACFFPVADSVRKRERDELEQEGESSGVEERSDESSETVNSGRVNRAARGPWGKAVRLEETDKFYQVVRKLFLSGMAPGAGRGVAITAVHKVAQGPRARAFQLQGQLLAASRGAGGGNAKFAWYGTAAVEHGFGRTKSQVLGSRAHGDGIHLSPPQSPYPSAMLAKADETGQRPSQPGPPSSTPTSNDFDSAVETIQNIVRSTDMNTRIAVPEVAGSFFDASPCSLPQALATFLESLDCIQS